MITERDPNREHYVLGIFYFNSGDKRLFVPKRLGYGSTFNFAHPIAWIIIAVGLTIILGRAYFRR